MSDDSPRMPLRFGGAGCTLDAVSGAFLRAPLSASSREWLRNFNVGATMDGRVGCAELRKEHTIVRDGKSVTVTKCLFVFENRIVGSSTGEQYSESRIFMDQSDGASALDWLLMQPGSPEDSPVSQHERADAKPLPRWKTRSSDDMPASFLDAPPLRSSWSVHSGDEWAASVTADSARDLTARAFVSRRNRAGQRVRRLEELGALALSGRSPRE